MMEFGGNRAPSFADNMQQIAQHLRLQTTFGHLLRKNDPAALKELRNVDDVRLVSAIVACDSLRQLLVEERARRK